MTASSTSSLTDRYVHAVLRHVPSGDRPELEREIRALIADTIEAKTDADPTLDAVAAERAALTELGEPVALAGRYTGRVNYLLGPEVYPVWRGMVTVLLGVLIPTLGIVVLTANLLAGSTPGTAIGAGITTIFNAAVQTLFWFTLVFALIERYAGSADRASLVEAGVAIDRAADSVIGSGSSGGGTRKGKAWSVDDLPALPTPGRVTLADMLAAIAANVFTIAALLWVQFASPFVIDGASIPLFDPALWSFWLPWFIVVAALEIVFTVAVYRRGHWTYAYAIGNAVLGAAFAIPALYLLSNHLLFNPAFVDAIGADSGDWLQLTTLITGITIAAVVGWDAIDGFLKAWRASRTSLSTN